jgi:hypothetical protein
MKKFLLAACLPLCAFAPPLAAQATSSLTDSIIVSKPLQDLLDKGKTEKVMILIRSYGTPQIEHRQDLTESRERARRARKELMTQGIRDDQFIAVCYAGNRHRESSVWVDVWRENNPNRFSLRTNLLYWLAGTPNIGFEWQPSQATGLLLNGAFARWSYHGGNKLYRLWMLSPEVRHYLGTTRRWFVGLEGHVGEVNLKPKRTGRQGSFVGAGVTGGYKLRLSPLFDMDFSLGLGYTHLKYDSYTWSNGYRVKKNLGLTKHLISPTQAGVSLIWKLK